MGADLYKAMRFKDVTKKYEPLFYKAVEARDKAETPEERDKAQEKVNEYYNGMYSDELAYFRDSYNESSLMWKFDLSWWGHLDGCITKKSEITPAGAKRLLKKLEAKEGLFETKIKDNTPDEQEYYRNKYIRFKKFLKDGIEHNLIIDCSI